MLANSGDPDQMPHYVASDLGMYCLPMYPFQGFPGKSNWLLICGPRYEKMSCPTICIGKRSGSGVECQTPDLGVVDSRPTNCHVVSLSKDTFTLQNQEAMAPSQHN